MLKPFNKFFNLLNRKEKNKILVLIFLLFIGMSMEVLGIGLLLPFLEIISDENIVLKYPILEVIFDNLSITTFNGQVYFFLILIFIILYKIPSITYITGTIGILLFLFISIIYFARIIRIVRTKSYNYYWNKPLDTKKIGNDLNNN